MPIRFFKQRIAILATASDTNGLLGAVEVASPRGAVPPLHVHHREDEAFYVVEGEYSVFVGDDVIAASPGTWVWGPRGVPHGYQVHTERGRHLSLTMPGGFEAFFEDVAAIATPDANPRNELSRLAAVAARYGFELLGAAFRAELTSTGQLQMGRACPRRTQRPLARTPKPVVAA
jgi:quercetin dioxygenase-like cupin family protein